ncbi:dTDP-4-amino-4,6-dideoxygalactose transaminase [Breznakibacter xylanolyticus]|uniref:dTDP-4-amino-4,6-dideoxygalactose transaminase n=1 Tax=Breznakibacter xylanolyticus TaxID=990 RepID=A0A2W7N1K1_9BACT|nr:DegT/DnrJ/EryC1/StrS family aminotransferase [Breznakibacter xylanolyticus]MBN2744048.1 DegT/DnrJ/EryC1/StrS family aminotransferase [Marinilabiliaceae bacterium]PZX14275.1 dTDP-4-amino-4,6-dideoxygalactose transaminase [Breznakibacter xylanolyticus]
MNVKFLDLKAVNKPYMAELNDASRFVLERGWYILGKEVEAFENEFAAYCGVAHCIGVGNGLDALRLIFESCKQLGLMEPGDEIIVPANTFIASMLAITQSHLQPILVDADPISYNIDVHKVEEVITSRTRAVLAVHLYGRLADVTALQEISHRHNLLLFEDAAQAHGARDEQGQLAGSFGDAAAFSFYPGKNLGALGDAGAVTTNHSQIHEQVRMMRNYGSLQKYNHLCKGFNSRLDELQAALLRVKLHGLDQDNAHRQRLADEYRKHIRLKDTVLPDVNVRQSHVYHVFPVLHPNRDELQKYLSEQGVETLIHYPVPPHKQQAYHEWERLCFPATEYIHSSELSLPMSPVHSFDEIFYVSEVINRFPG